MSSVNIIVSEGVIFDGFSKFGKTTKGTIFALENLVKFLEDDVELYISSQVANEIKTSKSITTTIKERIFGIFEQDKTTQGVPGFGPTNSIHKSAETLSFKGTTIILLNKTEKKPKECNKLMIEITPQEFEKIFKKTSTIIKKFGTDKLGSFTEVFIILSKIK